jgi:hypothetical protein
MRQQLPSVVLGGLNVYGGATYDANNFYWKERGTAANAYMDARVLAVPITGGTPTVLADHILTPNFLTSDGVNVYWTDTTGQVSRCAVSGCNDTPSVVASLQAGLAGLVADGTNVYFGTTNAVMECPVTGCGTAPTAFAPAMHFPLASNGTKLFLEEGNALATCSVTGCNQSPTTIAITLGYVSIFATPTEYLWISFDGSYEWEVGWCPPNACNGMSPVLARQVSGGVSGFLAIAGGDALWSGLFGGYRCSLAGCDESPTEIAQIPPPQNPQATQAGAVLTPPVLKGQNYYWLTGAQLDSQSQSLSNGRIVSCPVCGCNGAPRELVQAPPPPQWMASARADLAIGGSHAFWFDGLGDVKACSTSACNATATAIATKIPVSGMATISSGLAADNTAAYWAMNELVLPAFTADSSIYSCPLTGCGSSPKVLASGVAAPTTDLAVDASSLYWVTKGAEPMGPGTTPVGAGVMKLPLAGGVPQTLAAGQVGGDGHIAVDASYVYWANFTAGTILRVPIAGGAITTLASGQMKPYSVVIDGSGIYWYAGGVFALPTGQSTPVMLASGATGTPPIAVGGGYVYWYTSTDPSNTYSQGTLQRVPTGGGAVETVATQQSAFALAVAPGVLLYTENFMLMGLDL